MDWSFSPLDDELGLLPGGLTPRLVEAVAYLGMNVSFAKAGEVLSRLLGVAVDAETVRRLTEGAGRAAVAVETTAVEELERTLAAPTGAGDAHQQVSVDGAMVPVRGDADGRWAEVKTVVIGCLEQTAAGPKAVHLSYFSRLTGAAEFTRLARLEFHRRATGLAKRSTAVVDGAEWEQTFIDEDCPEALRVLDWSHATDHLSEAAQAAFGPGTPAASTWLQEQKQALLELTPEDVFAALAAVEEGRTDDQVKVIRGTRDYLVKRREQIRYAAFRAAGEPIGSGIVESANKLVVEARLKGAGRHWDRANVNAILALRTADASGRWDTCWADLLPRLRRPHRRHCRPAPPPPPAPEPPPPPPGPPLPEPKPYFADGRPTPHHPFNRFRAVTRAKL